MKINLKNKKYTTIFFYCSGSHGARAAERSPGDLGSDCQAGRSVEGQCRGHIPGFGEAWSGWRPTPSAAQVSWPSLELFFQ